MTVTKTILRACQRGKEDLSDAMASACGRAHDRSTTPLPPHRVSPKARICFRHPTRQARPRGTHRRSARNRRLPAFRVRCPLPGRARRRHAFLPKGRLPPLRPVAPISGTPPAGAIRAGRGEAPSAAGRNAGPVSCTHPRRRIASLPERLISTACPGLGGGWSARLNVSSETRVPAIRATRRITDPMKCTSSMLAGSTVS